MQFFRQHFGLAHCEEVVVSLSEYVNMCRLQTFTVLPGEITTGNERKMGQAIVFKKLFSLYFAVIHVDVIPTYW